MSGLAPVDDITIDAFEEALTVAAEILRPELVDLPRKMLSRIKVVSSDVYGRICGAKGIEVNEVQLEYLQTALALGVASSAVRRDVLPELSDSEGLVQQVVEVLGADPVFRESQDAVSSTLLFGQSYADIFLSPINSSFNILFSKLFR